MKPLSEASGLSCLRGKKMASSIDPLELLQTIVSEIPATAKSDGDTDWTAAVKQALCRLGLEKKFKVFGSVHLVTENIKRREWMLDLVWDSSARGGIELAVESEWGGQKEVLDDFEKLMCVKSPLKLLVFSSGESEKRPAIIEQLQNYLTDFEQHLKGKRTC